jgi:catechol 2,3-dioxygenase-like lactoylglutathione lyase family enzyme
MRLNQVTVPVIDVGRSISFYEQLGLTLIVKALPHYARLMCKDGESTFSLHEVKELPQGNGIWIYFEIDDLDNYVAALINKGFVFEEMPTEKNWLWRECRLKDPDNNQLIFYYGGENRLHPPWKI